MNASILGELTHEEVHPGLTLLIPLGSTEQHGPHLPLSTDSRIAEAIATRSAAVIGPDAVVGPTLPFGSSGEHRGFAGMLSIGTPALTAVLIELGRSATAPGGGPFERLVFVNGHGGNHGALVSAVETLRSEGRSVDAWWPRIPGGDAHAGRTETSLLLAIAPELVRGDRFESGNTAPLRTLLARMQIDGVRSISPNGILGDATDAHTEHGTEVLDAIVGQLVSFLHRS